MVMAILMASTARIGALVQLTLKCSGVTIVLHIGLRSLHKVTLYTNTTIYIQNNHHSGYMSYSDRNVLFVV